MAVNYTVRAAVVDIRQDTPKREDAFLVDTNVWYWLTYGACRQPYSLSKESGKRLSTVHQKSYFRKKPAPLLRFVVERAGASH